MEPGTGRPWVATSSQPATGRSGRQENCARFIQPAGKSLDHPFSSAYQTYSLRVSADIPITATAWLTYD